MKKNLTIVIKERELEDDKGFLYTFSDVSNGDIIFDAVSTDELSFNQLSECFLKTVSYLKRGSEIGFVIYRDKTYVFTGKALIEHTNRSIGEDSEIDKNINTDNMKKEYRDVFVIKVYDEVSSKAEYLFIDKEEYFLGSVVEDEIERKSYSLACKKFEEKSPLSNKYFFRYTISK
mgnify:CR=1 FL=1